MLFGDENTWVPTEQLNLENIYLEKNSRTLYSLEWKWIDSNNDNQLLQEGLATYTIYITIQSGVERDNI